MFDLHVGPAQEAFVAPHPWSLACGEVRSRDGTELHTSWVPGEGSPGPFYERLGCVSTGEIDDDEIVGRLTLSTVACGRTGYHPRTALPPARR